MKQAIQQILNQFGYEIHKKTWFGPRNRIEIMRRLGVNFVLDVGANIGTYGAELRRDGYKGKIWSYEPASAAFAELEKAAAGDELWKAIHYGCGEHTVITKINVSKDGVSSSLLPMATTMTSNEPRSAYISEETISICSLDESVLPHLNPADRLWLKVDTQGYEGEVFKGARGLMSRVYALECELSLLPLYEGQPLIDQMIGTIYEMGFRLVGISPVFFEPETSYALQVDGTFVRA